MNKNGTFLEYATFIFIIAFSFSLTKMQSDHKADVKEQKMLRELQIEQDAANERNWLDRFIRISQNIMKHYRNFTRIVHYFRKYYEIQMESLQNLAKSTRNQMFYNISIK